MQNTFVAIVVSFFRLVMFVPEWMLNFFSFDVHVTISVLVVVLVVGGMILNGSTGAAPADKASRVARHTDLSCWIAGISVVCETPLRNGLEGFVAERVP